MNQSLLTRLFKAIGRPQDGSLIKIAHSIIEDEKRKGHNKLADGLNNILRENLSRQKRIEPRFKLAKGEDYKIPLDRRYRLPLAAHIEHDYLRHEMVLSSAVEDKVLRIEKEYLARERLAHYGLRPRKKILLYGPSGCGKSMTGERIAWDLGLPFYRVRFDTVISSYLGESASNLQNLFESIGDYPCVLLLDEFDIIGKQRNVNSNDVGEIHRIVNILLGLLEDYKGEGILIATTNLEEELDKALFRRFDDFIKLPKPTEDEITRLLKIAFSALTLDKEIDLKRYAKEMLEMSSAIVVKAANDSAKKAIIRSEKKVSACDLDKALEENKAISR